MLLGVRILQKGLAAQQDILRLVSHARPRLATACCSLLQLADSATKCSAGMCGCCCLPMSMLRNPACLPHWGYSSARDAAYGHARQLVMA